MIKRFTIGSMIAVGLISMLLVSACGSNDSSSSNNWAGTWDGTVSCTLSGPLVLQIQPPSGNTLSVTYTFHDYTSTFEATISGDTATYTSSDATTQLTISGDTITFTKTGCQTATLTRQ